MTTPAPPLVRRLGLVDYAETYDRMRAFTGARGKDAPDELWLLEHAPVFTQGQAGKAEHLLAPGDIPVVQSNRGGQVTYHGPGQVVAYVLLDLHRLGYGARELVRRLERAMLGLLSNHGIAALAREDAPGVYVERVWPGTAAAEQRKIGSLGLRVSRGCSYHGLSLNVNMDLRPFARINPCGLHGMRMTQLADLGGPAQTGQAMAELETLLLKELGLVSAGAGLEVVKPG